MLYISSNKNRTKTAGIQPIPDAAVLYVPLQQHIGSPARAMVHEGEHVSQYQLIGQAASGCSANVHAPVSGTVLGVEDVTLAGGSQVQAISIQNDFRNEVSDPVARWGDMSVLDRIATAGVVGEGGAQFPTALKYDLSCRGKIKTLILNGTECEPYLSADYVLMEERTEAVLRGAEIVRSLMQIEKVVIVIERQNRVLIKRFAPFLSKAEFSSYRIQLLPDTYPQGGELQVIKSVTGQEIPRGCLPKDAGVLVNNVGTMYAICQAVDRHIPLVRRIITVSGKGGGNYGNYEVSIGTPVSHILKTLGFSVKSRTVVCGGPMMGKLVDGGETPIVKGTSGILLLDSKEERSFPCISCGYCAEACPMHLMPMKFENLVRNGRISTLPSYGLESCIECGACEYTCPSHIPLLKYIKEGKTKIKKIANVAK